jgi:hypothetical protein
MNDISPPSQIPPWYRQFWPWFLISFPVISVFLGFTMVYFATNGQDTLVIDNYYKEGKAINHKLEQVRNAQELGIETQLLISNENITLDVGDNFPGDGSALTLHFYHSTLADRDFTVLLTKQAGNRYTSAVSHPIAGKWRLSLLPFDESWKVQQEVTLPRQQAFKFVP